MPLISRRPVCGAIALSGKDEAIAPFAQDVTDVDYLKLSRSARRFTRNALVDRPNHQTRENQMTETSPAKPIPKPKPKPSQPLIELPEDSAAIFQAVGILPGDVIFSDQGASITVEEKQYRLFYSGEHRNAFEALKVNVKTTGASQRVIVYPYVRHFPKKEQPYQLAFQVVGFIGKPIEGCISREIQDFEFRIAGLWQFIPVCATPCITVLKNFTEERLGFIKESTTEDKVRFLKASHIPLLWSNPPVRPFRFNPRIEKEQQGKAAFVQITARFNPDQDVFEFTAMRSLPAANPPKYLKAGKSDKAEVLAKSQAKSQKDKGNPLTRWALSSR